MANIFSFLTGVRAKFATPVAFDKHVIRALATPKESRAAATSSATDAASPDDAAPGSASPIGAAQAETEGDTYASFQSFSRRSSAHFGKVFAARDDQAGVTLLELIFTLSILAVLTSISLPALGNLLQSAQGKGARASLITSLNLARSNAATRHKNVVVCPSNDQQTCAATIWWQSGWIVFEDADGNGARSASETLIEVVQAQTGAAIASTAGRKFVSYRDDGSATGTNLTYTVCDRRGAAQAATLVINNSGRIRQGVPTAAQASSACAAL